MPIGFLLKSMLTLAVAAPLLMGCQAVADNMPRDCQQCTSLRSLMDEYEANPVRSEDEYVGRRMDVGGTIWGIERQQNATYTGDDLVVGVELGITITDQHLFTGDPVKIPLLATLIFAENDENAWVLQKDKGEQILASCILAHFSERPTLEGDVYGLPILNQCEEAPSVRSP